MYTQTPCSKLAPLLKSSVPTRTCLTQPVSSPKTGNSKLEAYQGNPVESLEFMETLLVSSSLTGVLRVIEGDLDSSAQSWARPLSC